MIMYTKKQLQERFGISHNTLKDTIKVTGLNTGQRQYSQEEVYRIEQARHLLESGMTYEEVAAVMTQKSAVAPDGEAGDSPEDWVTAETADFQGAGADIARAVQAELTQQIQPVIAHATDAVLAQLPTMALQSLWTKVQQGQVKQAFQSSKVVLAALGGQPGAMKTLEAAAQTALPQATSSSSTPATQGTPKTAPLAKSPRRTPHSPTRTSPPAPAAGTTPPPVVDDLDKQVLGELVEGAALEALTETETA